VAKVTCDHCGKQKPASEFAVKEESRVSRAKGNPTNEKDATFFFARAEFQKWHTRWK